MRDYCFYPAGEGMAGKVELICDVVPDPVTGAQWVDQQFRVDPEQLLIWQPALVRDYKNAGGRFVKRNVVFAAGIARIHTEVEGYTIKGSVAVHDGDALVMETERLDPHGLRRAKTQVIKPRQLGHPGSWLDPKLRLTASPIYRGYVANTIKTYSLQCGIESVYEFDRTGYVFVDSTGGDDRPSGWMYVHGGEEDVIAALPVPAGCGVRAVGPVAGLCQPLECSDRNERRDAVAEVVNHWVLGGIAEGLAPSQARFVARFAALGAISVARALVPGKTPRTTVMVVDPDDFRSSILVRSVTSFFGPVAARRPLVDLRLATAAGGEAAVGAARHLAVYLADYNGRSDAHKIVDGTARGAYDGMAKSRATPSMKSAHENPVETMAWITGDRFPTKFTESTMQRMVTVRMPAMSTGAVDRFASAIADPEPQQRAAGSIIREVVDWLQSAHPAEGSSTDAPVSLRHLNDAIDQSKTGWKDRVLERATTEAGLQIPTRPIEVVDDMLSGAALLLLVADRLEVFDSPDQRHRYIDTVIAVAAATVVETTLEEATLKPEVLYPDLLVGLLTHGQVSVRGPDGAPPPIGVASQWGFQLNSRGKVVRQGTLIGTVEALEGQWVVALSTTYTAKALDDVCPLPVSAKGLGTALEKLEAPQGGSAVIDRKRATFEGRKTSMVYVSPELLGLNCDHLGDPPV